MFVYAMSRRVCVTEGRDTQHTACLFVCDVQRISQSPQLCPSRFSSAKQEINVARRVCVCVCVQRLLTASVSLDRECVC